MFNELNGVASECRLCYDVEKTCGDVCWLILWQLLLSATKCVSLLTIDTSVLFYQDVDDAQCTLVYAFLFVLRLLCVAAYSV